MYKLSTRVVLKRLYRLESISKKVIGVELGKSIKKLEGRLSYPYSKASIFLIKDSLRDIS